MVTTDQTQILRTLPVQVRKTAFYQFYHWLHESVVCIFSICQHKFYSSAYMDDWVNGCFHIFIMWKAVLAGPTDHFVSRGTLAKSIVICKKKKFHKLVFSLVDKKTPPRITFPPQCKDDKQICLLSQCYPKPYHQTPPLPASLSVLTAATPLQTKSMIFFLIFLCSSLEAAPSLLVITHRQKLIHSLLKRAEDSFFFFFSVAGAGSWFFHNRAKRDKTLVIG